MEKIDSKAYQRILGFTIGFIDLFLINFICNLTMTHDKN